MNLLAIETSGPSLSVAVKKGQQTIRHAQLKGHFKHVEGLIPLIDQLLKKERLSIRDIHTFLIGRGPGSFTGLRVGFATLKGFLSVKEQPCFGAYSFDLVAASIPSEKRQNLAVCLNAKRDKLYARFYRPSKKGWRPAGGPFASSPVEFFSKIPKHSKIAGDGLTLFDKTKFKDFEIVSEKYWAPKASALIRLFEEKSSFLKKLSKPKDVQPYYLRSSEAEERLKNKTKS